MYSNKLQVQEEEMTCMSTQPPTVVCKMEAQLEDIHNACTFFALIYMLSRCLLTKFLHRVSVGSLSRARCWLGSIYIHSLSCLRWGCLPFFQYSVLSQDFFPFSAERWMKVGRKKKKSREKKLTHSVSLPLCQKSENMEEGGGGRENLAWYSSGYSGPAKTSAYAEERERERTQPPLMARKMKAQSEYVHIACMFFAHLAPVRMLSRCLSTKFLHWSSVGSLLRVCCWLGGGEERVN